MHKGGHAIVCRPAPGRTASPWQALALTGPGRSWLGLSRTALLRDGPGIGRGRAAAVLRLSIDTASGTVAPPGPAVQLLPTVRLGYARWSSPLAGRPVTVTSGAGAGDPGHRAVRHQQRVRHLYSRAIMIQVGVTLLTSATRTFAILALGHFQSISAQGIQYITTFQVNLLKPARNPTSSLDSDWFQGAAVPLQEIIFN